MIEFIQVDRHRLRQARDAHNKIAVLKLTFYNTETQREFETRTAFRVEAIVKNHELFSGYLCERVRISLMCYCRRNGIDCSEFTGLMEQVREQISYSLELFKTPE